MTRFAALLVCLLMVACGDPVPSPLLGRWSTGDCGPNHLTMKITAEGIVTMTQGKVITDRRNPRFGETARTVYIELPDDPNPWLRYAFLKPLGANQIVLVDAAFSRADDGSEDIEVRVDPMALNRCRQPGPPAA